MKLSVKNVITIVVISAITSVALGHLASAKQAG